MMKTLYCQRSPIKEAIDKSFSEMSVDEQVEIEEAMRRWRVDDTEDNHVYEYVGTRYEILVCRIPFSRRKLVAVHDKNRDRVEAVNLEAGAIKALVQPAHLLIGPLAGVVQRNHGWTG